MRCVGQSRRRRAVVGAAVGNFGEDAEVKPEEAGYLKVLFDVVGDGETKKRRVTMV